jgi:F420-dependent oxidoreductase-like protein
MDLRIFTEPQQGACYDDLLAVARRTQECGFDGFFRSDHYLAIGGGDGRPGPTDAWTSLAAIARETSGIRLGTLVSPATFRLPGPLAIQVAQVDVMSGGRVELGLGAGWFEAEHRAYGIPFPDTRTRFDRFEEQLEIITGLWGTGPGRTYSYTGREYTVTDSPALPKPVQNPVPIIIGGGGKVRTPRLAARYAAEFNVGFATPDGAGESYRRVREACSAAGRDPDSLVLSWMGSTVVGRDDAEVARRAAAAGLDPAQAAVNCLCGTVDQVVQRLGELGRAGASRCYLQLLDLSDLEHLDLIASRVLPQLR